MRTEAGSFEVNRFEIDSILWSPGVGEAVKVRGPDGGQTPGVVRQVQGEQAQVQMGDGREVWVPMSSVAKG